MIKAGDLTAVGFEPRVAPAQAKALEWLRKVLATGPVPAREVHRRAKRAGLPPMSIHRARRRVGSGVAMDAGEWMLVG